MKNMKTCSKIKCNEYRNAVPGKGGAGGATRNGIKANEYRKAPSYATKGTKPLTK